MIPVLRGARFCFAMIILMSISKTGGSRIFLMLVAKGGHFPIANGFVVDGRRNVGNLKRPLYSARNHCIRRDIESMMEDHNYHQPSLAPSPRGRIGGL
ncbi:unnamed protein product [Penicillium nalgiovense]|uniref:Uncharacterized protein n=1 Tax=Penicillium nalgiovense TaxID=60175 RepID=A0A9W4MX13_PENNA|nr:unnamed protein product [Penicillium nalgiovense]CAG8041901.1 unnamed protein product [Penicillium nalgiovense]CAG8087516.1 unnamed protein product [Penicillium nalgiovense]CAG8090820.1 unnamed protein product [Penicillium nalgiovense]CAG8093455.1 unnamed protein product [Penicillium nalgiovense]